VLCGAIWWAGTSAREWFEGHAGEIDALFLARLGWTRTTWVHQAIVVALFALTVIVGPTLGLAMLVFAALGGTSELLRPRWLSAALSRNVLGSVTIFEVALILLPLQALYWKPRGLPANTLEPLFVATKLGVIFLLANVGLALMLRTIVATASDQLRR
jgi:hypothetical protein